MTASNDSSDKTNDELKTSENENELDYENSENESEKSENTFDKSQSKIEILDFDNLDRNYKLIDATSDKMRAWVCKHFTKYKIEGVKRYFKFL